MNIASSLIGLICLILHIVLSTKQNKFLGLIIPSINVLLSINAVLGFAMFNKVVNSDSIIQCISIFFIYNISTVILIGIYFACRKKINKNNELYKMNIQDLN